MQLIQKKKKKKEIGWKLVVSAHFYFAIKLYL